MTRNVIKEKKAPCPGGILLLCSLLISTYFFYWVFAENDDDQVHDAVVAYEKLQIRGKSDEAFKLMNDIWASKDDGPLDPIWLQLVSAKSNGYERLGYYLRILEGDPDREATYGEIANFIEIAPKAFHDEVKFRYLDDMSKISGIRRDWLQKYGLVLTSNK